ncbi:class I SAM-dependent methyltransferase [Nitrososphaera sp.]|uniref:class I SAM-dependent methyltransferase n=1 Tax=Nitrososphaera sp. TaxID=1971748 RepID=UPI00307FA062
MLETGVSSGASTSVILKAMEQNRTGQLTSIDLPPWYDVKNDQIDGKEYLVCEKESGCLVPYNLRYRWKLYKGRSKDLLPAIPRDLGYLDIFFHDSEHS